MFNVVNVTMDCVCALFTVLILIYLRISWDRNERLNRIFAWICVFNIGMLLGDIPNWLCEGFAKPWYPAALKTGIFVQYLSGCLLPWIYSLYIYTYLSEKTQLKKWVLPAIHTMFGMSAILQIINIYNEMYYYIDTHNVYHRGEWYWLSQSIPIVMLLFDAVIILRHRKVLRMKDITAFFSYLMLPIVAIIIQWRIFGIAITYLASSVSVFIIFLCTQSEQRLLAEQQKRKLDKAHVLVMLSQIQPHFLYNALLGIKQLCDTDPKKASDALGHFSYYLQGNLYSVSNPSIISFEKEIEHVRDYLYLEQMRFGERLKIRWEIEFADFLIPVLTIQPLVENAVRHGITKRREGGTITICSQKTADDICITVADDGIGFDQKKKPDDSRPHIGLENVRKRLELQCGGSLEIQSRVGIGTGVRITLPGNMKAEDLNLHSKP